MASCHQPQAITWNNVDLSLARSCNIHQTAISWEIPQPSITNIILKIIDLKFYFNFQGISELTYTYMINYVMAGLHCASWHVHDILLVNIIAADALAPRGARPSAEMVLALENLHTKIINVIYTVRCIFIYTCWNCFHMFVFLQILACDGACLSWWWNLELIYRYPIIIFMSLQLAWNPSNQFTSVCIWNDLQCFIYMIGYRDDSL